MTQYMGRRFITRSQTCEKCSSTNVEINKGEYICFKCGNKGLIETKPHYATDDVRTVTIGKQAEEDDEAVPFTCAVCKSKKPKPEWVVRDDVTFCSPTCMTRRGKERGSGRSMRRSKPKRKEKQARRTK